MVKHKDNVSLILLLTLLVGTLLQLKYLTFLQPQTMLMESLLCRDETYSVNNPAFISSKPLFNTTFIYHIKNVNGNISFNVNLLPQLRDWALLKPGQVFKLTVARNNQQVGDITYTIGPQPLINDVTITFDHNQSNNLLPNQTYMVGIGLPNDGVNDGDNFTGTIKVDVPDGFVFDSSRSNGVVTGSNIGDDLGMFNTLGSMEGISISQEAAGKPIIIEYNRTKSELGKGFILLYGHYTKNIDASQNTFTAIVTATTTNADGDKANYDGSIQTITKSRNISMPVENPARNSLDSSFAIGKTIFIVTRSIQMVVIDLMIQS